MAIKTTEVHKDYFGKNFKRYVDKYIQSGLLEKIQDVEVDEKSMDLEDDIYEDIPTLSHRGYLLSPIKWEEHKLTDNEVKNLQEDIMKISVTQNEVTADKDKAKEKFFEEYRSIIKKHFDKYHRNFSSNNFDFLRKELYDKDEKWDDIESLKKEWAEIAPKEVAHELGDYDADEKATEYVQDNPDLAGARLGIRKAYERYFFALRKILRLPENKAYIDAVKAGKPTDGLKIYTNIGMDSLKHYMGDPENEYEENLERYLAQIDKIAKMNITKPKDFLTFENAKDSFWFMGEDPATDKQVRDLLDGYNELKEDGLDILWLAETGGYDVRLRKEPGRHLPAEYGGSLPSALQCLMEDGPDEFKKNYGKVTVEQCLKNMKLIKGQYEEAKKSNEQTTFYDSKAEGLRIWFQQNGYDMFNQSVVLINGFKELEKDGKKVKILDMKVDPDYSKFDRGNFDAEEYKEFIQVCKDTQKMFRDNQNEIEEGMAILETIRTSKLSGTILASYDERLNNDPKKLRLLNDFRLQIYKLLRADENVCYLNEVNNKKERTKVDPLRADTEFAGKEFQDKELDILKRCEVILTDASKKVHRNSNEYMNVIASVQNLKEIVQKQYKDEDEARKEYVKAVDKVLKNISRYRDHKAKDGLNTKDGTRDKLIALEQVDQMLRTRYQSAEKRVYEDNISGIAELFETTVQGDVYGTDYLAEKAAAKINNVKQNKYADLFDLGKAEDGQRMSVRSVDNTLELFDTLLNRKKAVEESIKLDRFDKMNMECNAYDTAVKKEREYRASLDPKDDYGQEMLVKSAEKELYLISVRDACLQKFSETNNSEQAGKDLENEMAKYNSKGSIQARAFKFTYLTDADFNKEFKKRVLDGAKKGKVSQEDIKTFRDEALEACYTNYKGKDVTALDNLANVLGSEKNSKVFSKVGIKKLVEEEAKANPVKEKHDIKRPKNIKDTKVKTRNSYTKS